MSMDDNRVLIRLPGGLGKQVAATAFLRAWKEQHPESICHVESSYPDVFRGLPFVVRTYTLGQPRPYDYDEHRHFEVWAHEPYLRLAFRQGFEHLVEAFCRGVGVEPPKDKRGILILSDQEKEAAARITAQVDPSRPWIAFQPWGGNSFYTPETAQDPLRPRQVRDLPTDIAQGIVDELVATGAIVIQISLPTERRLDKVIYLDAGQQPDGKPGIMNPRLVIAILDRCSKFIGVDSFGQHAWAALGKPAGASVVLWGGTNPQNFSYPCHKNLVLAACETLHCGRPDLALPDIVDGHNVWICPHSGACMKHSPRTAVQALLEEQPGELV